VRTCFLFRRLPSSCYVLTWPRKFWVLHPLIRVPVPLWDSTPMTSSKSNDLPKAPLQIPSHWGLDFSIRIWGTQMFIHTGHLIPYLSSWPGHSPVLVTLRIKLGYLESSQVPVIQASATYRASPSPPPPPLPWSHPSEVLWPQLHQKTRGACRLNPVLWISLPVPKIDLFTLERESPTRGLRSRPKPKPRVGPSTD